MPATEASGAYIRCVRSDERLRTPLVAFFGILLKPTEHLVELPTKFLCYAINHLTARLLQLFLLEGKEIVNNVPPFPGRKGLSLAGHERTVVSSLMVA